MGKIVVSTTWPPIEMLTEQIVILPTNLSTLLKERYLEHGVEYATSEIDKESGLPINACMHLDNLKECEEEVVDAIFNALVFLLKADVDGMRDDGGRLLNGLLEVWEGLQRMRGFGKQDKETTSSHG